MRSTRFAIPALTAIAAIAAPSVRADVKLHHLFTPGAVLQQDKPIPIWGTARSGETVSVRLGDRLQTTVASEGRWKVTFAPLRASSKPIKLTVRGETTVIVDDILVGEVWICSGQSNMQWAVSQSANAAANIAGATDPIIRLFTVPRQATAQPLSDVDAAWQSLSPAAVRDFSAVAYAFGKAMRAAKNVPVGLISTNYGGTPAEAWTRRAHIEEDYWSIIFAQSRARYAPTHPHYAGGLYNAMIAPLIPYGIRGAIWYQGESNAGRAWEYRTLFPRMIQNWREDWGQGDFPFLFVQLAPFMAIEASPKESAWAELREAQLYTLSASPNTGMAVITDLGDERDIHPNRKTEVGDRLALAARKLSFGDKIVFSGPAYDSMKVSGSRIELRFKHADGGLKSSGPLTGFAIAGEDRQFVNANATIEGNTIIVSSPQVSRPVAVRFGWANYPVVNLTNGTGLPASPFRTDHFPVTTQPK